MSIGCPFSDNFSPKITALMPIFVKKTSVHEKNADLIPIFCQKKLPFSQKHGTLISFHERIFMKNTLL